jgi:glycosyltransferase involved in cell wall biosynthesis
VTYLLAEPRRSRQSTTRPIVIATIARPEGVTGVHTHFNAFLATLHRAGHGAKLVTPFTGQKKLAAAVFAPRRVLPPVSAELNVWWYEEWHYRMLKRALARELRDAGPVTVYAQCPLSARAALEVRDGSHQRVKMAVHFNGSQADEWVSQVGLSRDSRVYAGIRWREQAVLPRLDGIVYVSQYMRGVIQSAVPGVQEVPAVVVPNFVETRADVPSQVPIADLISIGTLEPRKNQAFLLHVLHEAQQLGHKYTLSLVGDGPSRASLEQLTAQLNLGDQVRFLGQQPDARHLLPAHRAYVHAATMESFGIVLVEAMAAGLPVVAAPVGGIPEVFADGREGAYWNLDDPVHGARTLIALLEDPARYDAAAAAARSRFESSFEANVVAGRLLEFLSQ